MNGARQRRPAAAAETPDALSRRSTATGRPPRALPCNVPIKPRDRVCQLIARFRAVYPDAHCELTFKNPLQLLIATILSAQCTDKRVNMVTPALFKKYKTAADCAQADPAIFQEEIRSSGFFRSKTKSILGACKAIAEKYEGKVPDTMDALVELPGVGRKTANVVLGNAFRKSEGIVVDTHVARLSQRLRLTRETDATKIEQDLMKIVPREYWTIWSHWLIWHGRRRCFARKPDCRNCEVLNLCPSGPVFIRTGEAREVENARDTRGVKPRVSRGTFSA
ncbi:MAG: endonuclease III [Verrucomicrobia bacterium]|nr:endonuclease III [Verrucomicrobiota bacterium]